MKKSLISAAVLLFLIMFSRPALAAPDRVQTLDVNGASMTITLPEGWDIINKDTANDDPVFAKYGITMDTLKESYEMQGIDLCVDAINPDTRNQILVGLMNDDSSAQIPNLSSLTDEQMDTMLSQTKADANLASMGCSHVAWKSVGEYKYIYYEFGSKPVYGIQYTTTVNGYYVNILLMNYEQKSLGEEERTAFSKAVESVKFTDVSTAPVALNAFGSTTVIAAAAGAVLFVFLMLMLQLSKRRVIYADRMRYDALNRVGGTLGWMGFRMAMGILVQLGSFSNMILPLYTALGIVYITLLVASFITMFIRNRTFVVMYIITVVFSVVINIVYMEYPIAISTGVVEMCFIIYLFNSVRVAILYKTKKVNIIDVHIVPSAAAAEPPSSYGINVPPVKRAVNSQDELRQVNPIAYKRNVVAIANGYRDFPSMIASNHSIDQNLMYATSEEDLNKVAAAYGMRSFEEWYSASEKAMGGRR